MSNSSEIINIYSCTCRKKQYHSHFSNSQITTLLLNFNVALAHFHSNWCHFRSNMVSWCRSRPQHPFYYSLVAKPNHSFALIHWKSRRSYLLALTYHVGEEDETEEEDVRKKKQRTLGGRLWWVMQNYNNHL